MTLNTLSENRHFGGTQGFYSHASKQTGTDMRLAVFTPPQASNGRVPVLYYLSGLTCTEENFTVKAGAQRFAAEHGLMLVAPDTSPRGAGIDGEDDSYDFGTGAGFYVDATRAPWSENYRMYSYITEELPALIGEHFPANMESQGIFGHSMGGHGALTIALKHPDTYSSVSAFAPICAPTQCDWGKKALAGYLGDDPAAWQAYDATALINAGHKTSEILIDQGASDEFLDGQLLPGVFQAACDAAGQAVQVRLQDGYDHSYYFISSFMQDHIAFHAAALNKT